MQCEEQHYSFSHMGFAVIANERAFLKVPISISPIQKQIDQAHSLCSRLRKTAKRLGDSTIGGLQLNSLSYSCDQRYQILNSHYETSSYFYSRDHTYDANVVFKRLKQRAIPIDYIIPDFTLAHPRYSQSPNSIPFSKIFDKKSFASPDDTPPKPEPEEEPDEEGSGENLEAPAEAEAEAKEEEEIDEEAAADEAYETHPSWSDLFKTNTNGTITLKPDEDDFENPFELIDEVHPGSLLKRDIPSYYHDILNHEKSKRQVFASILAAIGVSVGFNSLFGGARASQISGLNADVHELASKQNIIIAQLEHDAEAIIVNRAMTEGLRNLTIKTARFVQSEHFVTHGILLYTLINSEFDRIEDALQTHIGIIESAQNHHFHPSILTYDGSVSAFNQVKSDAAKRNLVPVIQTPQQLSQMHTSFSYTKTGITLLVEIPLISKGSTFVLHQYHPMPISLNENAYVQLLSNVPIVGLGEPDLNGKPLFIELTHSDLSQCNHFSDKVYLCTQQRQVKRPDYPSCVYSLFHNDHRSAEHTCLMNLKAHSHDHALAVGKNEFLYFSNESQTYYIVCQNNTQSSHQKLKGMSKVIVPSGCRLESSQFILYPQSDFEIPVQHEVHSWSNPTLSLIAKDANVNTLDKAIKALDDVKGAPPLDPASYSRFKELNRPFYHQYPVSFTSMIVASIAFLLITFLITIWVYKNYKANRRITKRQSAKYRGGKFMSNLENIAFLENLKAKEDKDNEAKSS